MKIAMLGPFHPYKGGLAQIDNRLYFELIKNHEVKAYNFRTLYPKLLYPGKSQFVNDDETLDIETTNILSSVNPFSYIKTARAINGYAPDVLIIPYWMSFFAPAFGLVCSMLNKKIKIISLVHNAIPHEKTIIDKPFARYFFEKCDAFICMSEFVKRDIINLTHNAKILCQHHPIYDHYAQRIDKKEACDRLNKIKKSLNIEVSKNTILFFGLIRDYKGLDLLLEATKYLDESYQIIIAGECYGSFSRYAKLIEESPLKENIKIYEHYIPDELISPLFSAADVLVLPYRTATQSGVIAVAFQLELPMIATNVGSIGDTVRNTKTGLVTKDVNAKSIAETIKDYFEHDISEFKTNIISEKERLSWPAFANSIISFIDEIS